jgi:hypothetical protein
MKRAKIMTTNDSPSNPDNPYQAVDPPLPADADPRQPQGAQVQDAPPAGYQPSPAQPGYQAVPGQFGNQAVPGQFGNQAVPGQFGYQGTPGQFGSPGYGYQANPTPMGYPGGPNQFQPGYGPAQYQPYSSYRMGGIGRASQQLSGSLWSGNLGAMLTGAVFGFGPLGGRRGRFRFLWYIRIALFLIALGAILYVGFVKHQWVVVCHNCDTGGDD